MKVEIEFTGLPLVGMADDGKSAWLMKLSGLALIVELAEYGPGGRDAWSVRSNTDLGDVRPTLKEAVISYCENAERYNRTGIGFQVTLLDVIIPVLRREASFIDNILNHWLWHCDRVILTTPVPTDQEIRPSMIVGTRVKWTVPNGTEVEGIVMGEARANEPWGAREYVWTEPEAGIVVMQTGETIPELIPADQLEELGD